MRFGLGPYNLSDDGHSRGRRGLYADVFEQARLADRLGFDSIWFSEHHFQPDGCCPAPLTALAAVATMTRSLRLGTATVTATLIHPIRIAEDVTVLDILSDGRVIVGLGAGYGGADFRAYGRDPESRDARFAEAVEVIVDSWTKTNFRFSGQHFKVPLEDFPVFAVTPKPVQSPHPPVWVGAFGRSGIERAARWGFPYLAAATEVLGALRRKVGWYREILTAGGRTPLAVEMPIIREVLLAETDAAARAVAEGPLLRLYRRYAEAGLVRNDAGQRLAPEAITWEGVAGRFVVGSPATCVERILEYERHAGMTYLLCRMAVPGIAHAAVKRSMQLFMSEVAPRFAGPAPWTPAKVSQ